jgi:hypothetical protein
MVKGYEKQGARIGHKLLRSKQYNETGTAHIQTCTVPDVLQRTQ